MEVAHLQHFFGSAILFSLIYDNYERNLKKELFLCHKNMDLSMEEIYNMPTRDRKYYISIHNKAVEKEKQSLNKKR